MSKNLICVRIVVQDIGSVRGRTGVARERLCIDTGGREAIISICTTTLVVWTVAVARITLVLRKLDGTFILGGTSNSTVVVHLTADMT